ncbi:hypothetical protein TCAL_07828 [Tigriopus californicus]|uniref:C2H2-type domain-containing protein n=1 Tax=Tigriopus californicus TaxID=6832 RepID=A0A553NQ60_TIGCA|nr:zinc finger protein 888-like [Tigriopus californicus]TRY67578.1 hypothetical protein TCAL_07828 [Tigriopus californicus]|eukprot:TCALIF_07828-PA protein Name:"Similar to Znf652 Zinc finger protein 652 (Mus musculus)" AED:0.02 eAED:0.02 QI:12/1/1/1/1/1/3/2571/535
MINPRRSVSDSRDSRQIIAFSEARLVLLETSAYLELEKPALSRADEPFKCGFCSKTTSHEHEFNGRVKFSGKENKYMISFIKTTPPPKRCREPLQIVPVPKKPKSIIDQHAAAQSNSKIYPLIVQSELEALELLKSLVRSFEDNAGSSDGKKVAAVRVGEDEVIHLVKQSPTKSVLKVKKCQICSNKEGGYSIQDLDEFYDHVQENHKNRVVLRKISCPTAIVPQEREMFQFPCDKCDEIFESDDERIKHCNVEHASKNEIQYQCISCLQMFATKTTFHQHLHTHTKDPTRSHVCNICSKAFVKVQHLRDHHLSHTGAKPFPCQKCDKRYTTAYSLKFHEINVHGEGEKPKCQYCDKSFYNTSQVNKHIMRIHLRDSRLHCQICQKFFLRKDNLEEHLKNVHGKHSESLKCKVCGLYRASQKSLEDHMQNDHGLLPWNTLSQGSGKAPGPRVDIAKEMKGHLKCKICEHNFLPAEMESHLRFSHGVMPVKPGALSDFSVSEAAEVLLRNLTPQPDYLLRCLTPLPMEILDDFIGQ